MNQPKMYRKKPVVVEVVVWNKMGDHPEVEPFIDHRADTSGQCVVCGAKLNRHGWIGTLEGGHRVCPGDRIIKGVQRELYPCKPDIFYATYEPVRRSHIKRSPHPSE